MSEPKVADGDLIRLFYELWEATVPGREYIVSSEIPDTFETMYSRPGTVASHSSNTLFRRRSRTPSIVSPGRARQM